MSEKKKKKILILGGNVHFDRFLGYGLEELLEGEYEVHFHHYNHWPEDKDSREEPKGNIDFKAELNNLKDLVEKYEPDYVIAKSAGSVLTLHAIAKDILNPQKVVLMGLPLEWENQEFDDKTLEDMLSNTNLPYGSRIIQQTNDPFASYSRIEKLLYEKVQERDYKLHEDQKGKNHKYEPGDIIDIIREYFAENQNSFDND